MHGIYSIYKPKGWTSNDVVMKVKKITGEKKVGHAGTLDPLAEGVLVIAVGREFTKQINSIVKKEKEYIAEVKLEENSTTDDEEGEKTQIEVKNQPELEEVKNVLPKFLGDILQMPPKFSAVKVRGKEAYKRARGGEKFRLGERQVEIKEIQTLGYSWPILKIRVTTGSGTYIRSLARDIGEELSTGGYLASLQRVRVGDFNIEDSISVEDFEKKLKEEKSHGK